MTSTPPVLLHPSTTPNCLPTRRTSVRLIGVAVAATVLLMVGGGVGPLVAVAGAQSSALQQSLGGSQPVQQAAQKKPSTSAPTTTATESDLNAPADFTGPGIAKGVSLIGWAKAGALVIGVLTLTIGIPASKAMKEAGNHHASGIRAGVMSVGGATLLAGVAGTLLPKLMA